MGGKERKSRYAVIDGKRVQQVEGEKDRNHVT